MTDAERTEYVEAHNWWRTLSQMRRRDIALFTGGQGAVLAVIGNGLWPLNVGAWALSVVAFSIAIIGLNNERRLYAYLSAFRYRAENIEQKNGMNLIRSAQSELFKLRFSIGSSRAFQSYYGLVAGGWIVLWFANLLRAWVT